MKRVRVARTCSVPGVENHGSKQRKNRYTYPKCDLVCFCFVLVSLSAVGNIPAGGEELLVNGDFEIGTPEDGKPDSFACKGWRRLLWKEMEPNSWLSVARGQPYGTEQ